MTPNTSFSTPTAARLSLTIPSLLLLLATRLSSSYRPPAVSASFVPTTSRRRSSPSFDDGDHRRRHRDGRGFLRASTRGRWMSFGTTSTRTTMDSRLRLRESEDDDGGGSIAAETFESDAGAGGAMKTKTKVLGICGAIGSGKSSACKLMVGSIGCLAHIDSDSLAHGVYEPGCPAMEEIVSEFGREILTNEENKEIDRKKLGAIVFSDPSAMANLERIVWPHVRAAIETRIDEIRRAAATVAESGAAAEGVGTTTTCDVDIIVVEAAVLLDAGWDDLFDGTWVVRSSESTAVRRLVEHRGMAKEDARTRIEAQKSRRGIGVKNLETEVAGGVVTAVIDNDGSLFDLQEALESALSDPSSFKDRIPALLTKEKRLTL